MANVYIDHPQLGPQQTRLSSDVSSGASSSSVENNDGFADNDYVVLGQTGEEKTEIIQLSGVTGTGQIDHTTGPNFDHSARDPVSQIKYNQAKIYRAPSETGTYSLVATVDLDVDKNKTVYDDTGGSTTSWYKVRYYNSETVATSSYSSIVQATGYTSKSLRSMTDEILLEFGDEKGEEVTRAQVRTYLRAGVRKLTLDMIKTFPDYRRQYTTQSLTDGTAAYDVPTRFIALNRIDVNFGGSDADDAYKCESFADEGDQYPNTTYYKTDPRVSFRGDTYVIKPTPDSDSGTAFVWYWDYPEEMTDDSDEHGLPYGARESIVAFALHRCWKKREPDIAATYLRDYEIYSGDYIDFVAQTRQVSDPKTLKVTYGSELYSFDS